MKLSGKVWVFGENIDTDLIISGKYLTTRDPDKMSSHVFEAVRPEFSTKVHRGDVIVAGRNFGSGSSREEAPVVLKRLGISIIIARSFARLFFRNAINIGLPVLECKDYARIADGDIVEADLEAGAVKNLTKGEIFTAYKIPQFLSNILEAGGALEAYRRRHGKPLLS